MAKPLCGLTDPLTTNPLIHSLSHARPQIHCRKRRTRQTELRQPRREGRRRSLRPARRDAASRCRPRSRSSIARRTRSRSRSARPRTRPSARPARKKAGSCASKTQAVAGRTRRARRRAGRRSTGRFPTCRTPTRRSASTTSRTWNCSAARRRCRSSTSSRSTTSNWPRSSTWSISRPGASVAGHGFYFLKNEAVLLELALQRYAVDVLMARGLHAA